MRNWEGNWSAKESDQSHMDVPIHCCASAAFPWDIFMKHMNAEQISPVNVKVKFTLN